jgi:hypothetical protein
MVVLADPDGEVITAFVPEPRRAASSAVDSSSPSRATCPSTNSPLMTACRAAMRSRWSIR